MFRYMYQALRFVNRLYELTEEKDKWIGSKFF